MPLSCRIRENMGQSQQKYRYTGISLLVLMAIIGVILFLSATSQAPLGRSFVLFSWWMILRWVLVICAGLMILGRLTRWLVGNNNFIYIFSGTANLSCGLVALGLFYATPSKGILFYLLLLNVVAGLGILADVWLLKSD